jgi:hypothetical protein
VLSGGGVKRLRKTPGAITARSAAHANMVISATVNAVSGKLADPPPPPPAQFVRKPAQPNNRQYFLLFISVHHSP